VASTRRAYILKERVADRSFLLDAVESVARERPMLDPQIAGMVLGPRVTPGQGLDSLTAGEAQVLALLADGASNATISSTLDLTPRAVERRINAIFTKLSLEDDGTVNRRVLAALAYVRNGSPG
jgi:DNA-binding NarL/FixJ family response regulator